MTKAHDGQNRTVASTNTKELSCFFCFQTSIDCRIFSIKKGATIPAEFERYRGKSFVTCPSCWSKGLNYLSHKLLEHARMVDEAQRLGYGDMEKGMFRKLGG